MNNLKIGVLGSGSWATAIAKILQINNHEISWYIREQEIIDNIKKYGYNSVYLSSAEFNQNKLTLFNDINEFLNYTDLIIVVIPSAFLTPVLEAITTDVSKKYFVNAVKGLIPEENIIVTDFLKKHFNIADDKLAYVTGPCHAEEVAQEKLSYLTVASTNLNLASFISQSISSRFIVTVINNDLTGTQYASVMKNIYAVGAGISHGLHYGDNYLAVFISNAIQEMERFLSAVNSVNRDIKASAYLGDLLVTGYSQFSRNRTFGSYIGKGYSVEAAQAEMLMVAEGYYAVKSIHEINKKLKAQIPIAETIYSIIYEHKNPAKEFEILNKKLQ